jgi:hypothetical protein
MMKKNENENDEEKKVKLKIKKINDVNKQIKCVFLMINYI